MSSPQENRNEQFFNLAERVRNGKETRKTRAVIEQRKVDAIQEGWGE